MTTIEKALKWGFILDANNDIVPSETRVNLCDADGTVIYNVRVKIERPGYDAWFEDIKDVGEPHDDYALDDVDRNMNGNSVSYWQVMDETDLVVISTKQED